MFDDFDTQIQCEELIGEGLSAQLQWQDYLKQANAPRALRRYRYMDVMDCCEVIPIQHIKNYRSHGHMENNIIEEIDFADLWDESFKYEEIEYHLRRYPS